MNSADVFAQIEKMGDLPSLPQTLLQIQTVAEDANSSADDLAKCILRDQALTMRVIKVVNSAMYQRKEREEIRTVRRAVIVMGFETVRKLALGLSVFDMMSKLSRSPFLGEIGRHSLVTAGFAQILAEASGLARPEEAFVAGLVHDIGKVVLVECSAEAMDQVLQDEQAGVPGLDAERRRFGLSHDRAGRRLAESWNLPGDITSVIGDHHDFDPLHPPRNLGPLMATIVYADVMSRFTCRPEDNAREYRILRKAGRVLNIPSAALDGLYDRVSEKLQDLGRRLGVDLGDLQDYGRVVNVDGSASVAPRVMNPEEIAVRTAQQLELYRRVGAGLAQGERPRELLGLVLDGAVEILGFERVVLLEADRDGRMLRPLGWAGPAADELAAHMSLPLTRDTGPVARALLEHRSFHVPQAASDAYSGQAGTVLLQAARCTGYAVAPVPVPGDGMAGVLYGDCGPDGDDVAAEQATELAGLAQQAGLILGAMVQPVG